MTELYIGLMSGTSIDSIDAVLVDFSQATPQLLASHQHDIPKQLRATLVKLNSPGNNELASMAKADVLLGQCFADAVNTLLSKHDIEATRITAIGSHGQTLRHVTDQLPAYTLQIGDPNTIAALTGITTVADFRRRDLAEGGQGAPLMPAFHNQLFRRQGAERVVLNIGGMANITLLPVQAAAEVIGFDTGPGNVLMDDWVQRHQKVAYDKAGQWAASGDVDDALLKRLLGEKYFQLAPPKSTGRDLFNRHWLETMIKKHGKRLQRKNVQATLCELSAVSITDAIHAYAPNAETVIVCGGGVHNRTLMFRLQLLLGDIPVQSSEDLGIDPDDMEAIGFAWLARQTINGKPGNLPSVTGAHQPAVLGGIYPGTVSR